MAGSMPPFPETEAGSPADSLIELSPYARLPRLDLGIDWGTPRQEAFHLAENPSRADEVVARLQASSPLWQTRYQLASVG